jgi:hypothetical protein
LFEHILFLSSSRNSNKFFDFSFFSSSVLETFVVNFSSEYWFFGFLNL